MRIGPEYCVSMAHYNAWQNAQLTELLAPMPQAELTRDRGGFFGSILGTLNHLLWVDLVWMARFAEGEAPEGGIASSPARHATFDAWRAERQAADRRFLSWADGVQVVDLEGDLTWYSGAAGREVSRPLAGLVVHMFNHQTHHRGQVHAMLTAAGREAPVSDLFLMPEGQA